jgi:Acetyltransferase (GNAT) domain
MHFVRFDLTTGDWAAQLARLPGGLLSHTPAWLSFLQRTQHGEPVAALLMHGDVVVGAFAGMVVTMLGARILGSPFPGWTTSYMGLSLADGIPRAAAMQALVKFVFEDLNCIHMEMMDRHLTLTDLEGLRYRYRMFHSWEVDLNEDSEKLIGTFSRSCRWKIRTAEKHGLVVEVADDPGFVDDYYAQLRDTFARQQLVPTYPKERVRELISALAPSGQLLLLRVRTPKGLSAATGIFHSVDGERAYGWGYASRAPLRHMYPNEFLMFKAMNLWRARSWTWLEPATTRSGTTPGRSPCRGSRSRNTGSSRACATLAGVHSSSGSTCWGVSSPGPTQSPTTSRTDPRPRRPESDDRLGARFALRR